ncbi:MAG: VWA domain-containing protein [Candidatus Riflebacteria bacterium]|nr:VWA domain-containing protein [Candidatus Riflebacteria bacterium]
MSEGKTFRQFEKFGAVADEKTRRAIVEYLLQELQKTEKGANPLTNAQTDNFSTALENIIDHKLLRELCKKDPKLAEDIALEILDFLNATKLKVDSTDDPFAKEGGQLAKFRQCSEDLFETEWKNHERFLNNAYNNGELDTEFYRKQFEESSSGEDFQEGKHNFESVKEHLSEKWESLLNGKRTAHELRLIDEGRKKFCEDLYRRLDNLKKLQEAVEPFCGELGRLWDLSKGSLHRIDLDILKKYSELLKRDKSLTELAEMLGRMQKAEKEYEEELFANTRLKAEWKTEYAHKADLVGVRESDDLSSMLPAEAALLGDPVLETVFLKKFAEKKLQTFEFQNRYKHFVPEQFQDKRQKAKEGNKGPFIVCVDTSGSMHGVPEAVAKTLCFAILKIAIRDSRKCYLILFSGAITTVNLTDFKTSLEKLMDFLGMSFGGGTDENIALKEAVRMLNTEEYRNGDVLMISDFVTSGLTGETLHMIKEAKKKKAKFHSLVIGSSGNQGEINEFDSNWIYDPNNPERVISLVRNLRSI